MTKKSKKFSRENKAELKAFSDRLKAACAGWFYMSETDAPIEPFFAEKKGGMTKETILKATASPDTAEIEEGDVASFFSHLWLAGDSRPDRARSAPFQNLRQLLEQNLTDLKVFRIGRIRIEVYVVGLDHEGNLAGIKTNAVET
jgi:Nuclease A inhibitor-like protein.